MMLCSYKEYRCEIIHPKRTIYCSLHINRLNTEEGKNPGGCPSLIHPGIEFLTGIF
jgi:hypothetical protein